MRDDAYLLMNSHSSSVRKPESTNAVGRRETVVISITLPPRVPSVTGIGTYVLWPMRTPGQMNWPPV